MILCVLARPCLPPLPYGSVSVRPPPLFPRSLPPSLSVATDLLGPAALLPLRGRPRVFAPVLLRRSSLPLVKYLIQRGADHNAVTKAARTSLQNALKRKAVPLVDELVEKGAEVGCLAMDATARGNGWTPMHLAAEIGSLKLLQVPGRWGREEGA